DDRGARRERGTASHLTDPSFNESAAPTCVGPPSMMTRCAPTPTLILEVTVHEIAAPIIGRNPPAPISGLATCPNPNPGSIEAPNAEVRQSGSSMSIGMVTAAELAVEASAPRYLAPPMLIRSPMPMSVGRRFALPKW